MAQPTLEELKQIAQNARAPFQERIAAASSKEDRSTILRESFAAVTAATNAAMLPE